MTAWAASSVLDEPSMRREVLFFPAAGAQLYGSIYVTRGESRFGVVMCPPSGVEAGSLMGAGHLLARRVAGLGGAAILFHPPTHGDSSGVPEELTLDALRASVVEASRALIRRVPVKSIVLVGARLGAAVAALAWREVGAEGLALVQPALDPRRYFQEMISAAARFSLEGSDDPSVLFGYPLGRTMVAGASGQAPGKELGAFPGRGIAVRYERPESEPVPATFEEVRIEGNWRIGARMELAFVDTIVRWLGAGP